MRAALSLIALLAVSARADTANNVLVGVRLTLTTDVFFVDRTYSTAVEDGFVRIKETRKKTMVKTPSTTLTGYVVRLSTQPPLEISDATRPSDLTRNGWIEFHYDKDLVQIKYPAPAVVDVKSPRGLRLPLDVIAKIEKFYGRFDGHEAYGEPFYVPADRAALLEDSQPVYSCALVNAVHNVNWVSYNHKYADKALQSVCDHPEADSKFLAPLIKKGGIFPIVYPSGDAP